MAQSFLLNKSLQKFVEVLKLSEEQKNTLIAGIPQMDKEERVELLGTLKEIYLLDLEEAGAIERIQKNWQVD